jgi:hypothetical protein
MRAPVVPLQSRKRSFAMKKVSKREMKKRRGGRVTLDTVVLVSGIRTLVDSGNPDLIDDAVLCALQNN